MGKLKTKHSVAEGKAGVLPSLARPVVIIDLRRGANAACLAQRMLFNWLTYGARSLFDFSFVVGMTC